MQLINRFTLPLTVLALAIFLASCGTTGPAMDVTPVSEVEDMPETVSENPEERFRRQSIEWVRTASIETLIGQMIMVDLNAFSGTTDLVYIDDLLAGKLQELAPGGVILFKGNLENAGQVRNLTAELSKINPGPFIAIDEEGGLVSRIRGNGALGISALDSQQERAVSMSTTEVEQEYRQLAESLADLGINLNFAPVADVGTTGNIGSRSFSDNPAVAAAYVRSGVRGLRSGGLLSVIKHFPGHGSTVADPHLGISTSSKTLDELRRQDLEPFLAGFDTGIDGLMCGHIVFPEVSGEPVTFSSLFLTDLLRGELEYEGLVFSDALNMGAVSERFDNSTEAAKAAILAGVDVLVLPAYPVDVQRNLITAVDNGEIPRARIEASVLRIISKKIEAGLFNPEA